MATIYFENHEYTIDGDKYLRVTLTGDTYQAREIIKSLGYTYDDTPNGKSWGLPAIKTARLVPGSEAHNNIKSKINETSQALAAAGYKVSRH